MIPPQELKNKSFTRTGKGYDIAEVDEYIDFVIEKYSEIFAQCDKYDKKLRIVSSRIGEIQQEENTIHKLVISTQKNCDRMLSEADDEAKAKILRARETAEQILDDAREKAQTALYAIERKAAAQIEATEEKSDALLQSARTRCLKLLSDFKKEIAVQRENILNIQNISEEFNTKLLSMYKNHLNLLSENTTTPIIDLEGLTESKLFDSVMQEIKKDAAEIASKHSDEYDFDKEMESIKESRKAIDDYEDDVKIKSDGNIYNNGCEDDNEEFEDYGEDEYAEDDEDVKVFAKNGTGNNSDEGFDLRFTRDESGPDDGMSGDEEPMATYDSDDYEYEDENYSDTDDNGGESYAEEVYGIDGDEEDFDDPYDDIQSDSDSKGFFGLFKSKKKKKKDYSHSQYPDDGEDDDNDNIDIFEDLDEDE